MTSARFYLIFFCEEFTRILKSYLWRLRTIYQLSIFIHACMRTFDFHNENDYQWSHLMFQSCRKKSVWVCMEVSKQTLNPGEIWGRVGTISKALWTVILTLPPLQQHQQKKHSSIMNGMYDRFILLAIICACYERGEIMSDHYRIVSVVWVLVWTFCFN